jgi:flagellar biosynthesis/type III secretory pathway protein FliH
MTSSFKATSGASVRVDHTPRPSSVWALNELVMPDNITQSVANTPLPVAVFNATLSAEEKSRLIDEGYARGLADGELKATNAANARLGDALGVVARAASQIEELSLIATGVLEENISALSVIVARQIVGREVSLDRELVGDLVRRALTEFPIDQSVRIRVNPIDLSVLTMHGGAKDSAPITGTRDASWVADDRIARGGCLLEGRDRIVDGRVDSALERAYRRMGNVDA